MGDEQDRLPGGVQAPEELEHLVAAFAVERAGRLVGEQQRRLVGQGASDREPLALPAGEHSGQLGGLVADAQQVEQVARPVSAGVALAAGDRRAASDDVLEHRHALQQVEELEHDADVPPAHVCQLGPRPAGERLAGDHDLAFVGVSRPATRLSSVDLPQPDGPMTATNSPPPTIRSTPRSARTGALGLERLAEANGLQHFRRCRHKHD